MRTPSGWVSLPENRAALDAVGRVADGVCGGNSLRRAINPLVLHGPSGTGKTRLLDALIADVTTRRPDRTVCTLTAGDFDRATDEADLIAARQADLLTVEDLQHLTGIGTEILVRLVDRRVSRGLAVVCTAAVGPAQLTHLPVRLTSRLTEGLIVGMGPLSRDSRETFLRERAEVRGMKLTNAVFDWLAGHQAGSARQLEGALNRLQMLARLSTVPLDVAVVAREFETEAEARRPTVERIAQRVGRYYQIAPERLQSKARSRQVMLPRQVGMYLARELTSLSLQQIGAYFGGRDHSTVLHACRKVEQALTSDIALDGAVRQLHADLA